MGKAEICASLLLCATLSALGESRRENEKKCVSSNPDISIAGCTELIQSGRESTANLAGAYRKRASAYMRKSDYDHAIQDYDDLLHLNPKNAPAYTERGSAHLYKGDYDRAIQDYDEAIRLDPKEAHEYDGRGSAYFLKSDRDRAMQDFDQAIRLNPNDAIAYSSRGVIYIDKGDYDRAIQDYNDAIRLNPNDPYAYYNRGDACIEMGDYNGAMKDLNEAIRLNPNFAGAYYNRGDVFLYQSNLTAALADFEYVISAKPPSGMALYAALMRKVVIKRQGRESTQPLEALVKAADLSKWPGPLLKLYMGQMKVDEVMSSAASTDANTQKRQECEANYFTGLEALLHDQTAAALTRFKAARDSCPKGSLGYGESLAELRRLGIQDSPPN